MILERRSFYTIENESLAEREWLSSLQPSDEVAVVTYDASVMNHVVHRAKVAYVRGHVVCLAGSNRCFDAINNEELSGEGKAYLIPVSSEQYLNWRGREQVETSYDDTLDDLELLTSSLRVSGPESVTQQDATNLRTIVDRTLEILSNETEIFDNSGT